MRRLQLVELTERTCRWPHGDPHQGPFYFCGANTTGGKVYCEYHHKRAFARTREA
jgi:GcrA cell cycle regulator